VEYIKNEREILIKLRHQFIVRLFYCFKNERKLFFALEYCPGGELFNILLKRRRLSENQAMFYSSQVLLALEYLHENGIVYRDLKPENVVIDAKGSVLTKATRS